MGRERSTRGKAKYAFRLYVTGTTAKSTQAIAGVKHVLEARLSGLYTLEVVDIYQQPRVAGRAQVTMVPTLVRERPLPPRKIVGQLDAESILARLDLPIQKDKTWAQER